MPGNGLECAKDHGGTLSLLVIDVVLYKKLGSKRVSGEYVII